MILTVIVSAIIGGFSILLLLWYRLKWSRRGEVRYLPNDIPILGHLRMLQDRDWFNSQREKWFQENNDTFGMYFLLNRIIITRDVAVCEDLLSNQRLVQKSRFYWPLIKFLGNGLVTSTGDLWKKRRRMITPAFHFNILNDFLSIMENRTKELVEILKKYHAKGESFDAFQVTKPFSLSIICETSMGVDLPIDETDGSQFKEWYENVVSVLFQRQLNPVLRSDWIYSWTKNGKVYYKAYNQIRQFVNEVIEKRLEFRKSPQAFASKRRIFIDTLLDAYESKEIDVDGILNEVTTFVNAGYETTATSLAWALYCIGRDKRVQEKLYKEVSSFNKDGALALEDLKELKYLDLVVKESLRLHPAIPRIARKIDDGTVLGGITLPSCSFVVDILLMNRNPKTWESPLLFLPERFDNFEKETKKSAFMYIPFSAGPRNCIGQRFAVSELKSALYHLVRCFEISSLQKEDELEETFDLTHGCKNGLILTAIPRK